MFINHHLIKLKMPLRLRLAVSFIVCCETHTFYHIQYNLTFSFSNFVIKYKERTMQSCSEITGEAHPHVHAMKAVLTKQKNGPTKPDVRQELGIILPLAGEQSLTEKCSEW